MRRIGYLILLCAVVVAVFFLCTPYYMYGADMSAPDFRDDTKWLLTRVKIASMVVVNPRDHAVLICVFGTTYFYTEAGDHDLPMVGTEIFSRTDSRTPIYKEWGITDQPLTYGLRVAKKWHISKDPETQIVVTIHKIEPTPNNTEFALVPPDGKKRVSIPLSSHCTKAAPPQELPYPPHTPCPDALPNFNIGDPMRKT